MPEDAEPRDAVALTRPPPPTAAAQAVFGAGLGLATRYAIQLTGTGIERGLLGPRERDRIWDRHLVNCAVVGELLPLGSRVVDVGSGAGLPGLALACARADLQFDLVDSLRRRVDFLTECVAMLGMGGRVRVVEGRAESEAVATEVGDVGWVTARAVATLDQLCRWCQPLLSPAGKLLAIKGEQAEAEVSAQRATVRRLGWVIDDVVRCGVGIVSPPTTVVILGRR
jgi:16S rRNA (guanine527-N7)-methyltransferase